MLKRFFLTKEQQTLQEKTSGLKEYKQKEELQIIGKMKNIKGKSNFYSIASIGNFIVTFQELA